MTDRSRAFWGRLGRLLEIIRGMELSNCLEAFDLSDEKVLHLRREVARIVQVAGGVDLQQIDFDDPAGGALAQHAFAVLERELTLKSELWTTEIADIKARFPLPPDRSR